MVAAHTVGAVTGQTSEAVTGQTEDAAGHTDVAVTPWVDLGDHLNNMAERVVQLGLLVIVEDELADRYLQTEQLAWTWVEVQVQLGLTGF